MIPSLSLLATREYPIHASSLDCLIRCPWFFLGREFMLYDDQVGEPADTGTAVGRAIELWHAGKELKAALEQTKVEAFEPPRPFPQAKFEDVERMFTAYVKDPRNANEHVLSCEMRYTGEIVKGIFVTGRYDQIRRTGGERRVWDLKAGHWATPHSYACQLLAYSILTDCAIGGIIKLRDYIGKGQGAVFRPLEISKENLRPLLLSLKAEIERLRAGEVLVRPSEQCSYCKWGGLESCLPALRKVMT